MALLSHVCVAAQPAVTPQEQQITTNAPGVAEAAATHAAVTPQEQENTSDCPRVEETAALEADVAAVTAPQEQGENTDSPGVAEAAEPAVTAPQEQAETTDAPGVAEKAVPEAAQPGQENTDAPAEAAGPQAVQPAVSQREENRDAGAVFAPFNWEGFQPEILESSLVPPYDPESGTNVLLYPSLVEQLRQNELERKERKRLSKMPVQDTTTYLEMSDEDCANEPKLGSLASFRRLCQRDATYRLYSRRVRTYTTPYLMRGFQFIYIINVCTGSVVRSSICHLVVFFFFERTCHLVVDDGPGQLYQEKDHETPANCS